MLRSCGGGLGRCVGGRARLHRPEGRGCGDSMRACHRPRQHAANMPDIPAPRPPAPALQERADASHYTLSNQQRVLPASPPRESMRRVASAGHMSGGGGGLKRVASGAALRRPPSAGNLQTHSRNSGGSELFDALLQAATGADAGALEPAGQGGDPPVTSRHYATAQLGRQRSRMGMWAASHNEVDSLAAAMEDFQVGR